MSSRGSSDPSTSALCRGSPLEFPLGSNENAVNYRYDATVHGESSVARKPKSEEPDAMKDFFAGDVHELTEKLAYKYWERRGRPLGSPEIDWFQAERALAPIHSEKDCSLSSLRLEADEGPYRPG